MDPPSPFNTTTSLSFSAEVTHPCFVPQAQAAESANFQVSGDFMTKINSKTIPKSRSSPAGTYPHTTTEELIAMFPIHEEKPSKCLVYILAGIVTLLAVWTVFASIVLRGRDLDVKLGSARVMHISYRASPTPSLNATMVARVTLTNPNFGPFDYGNSTVSVWYGVTCVGVGEMGGAAVEARETKEISVTVNIRSSERLGSGNFTNDIHSGILKLRSYAELSGTVHLLKIVKKRKTIVMACILNLNLTSHSFRHFQC